MATFSVYICLVQENHVQLKWFMQVGSCDKCQHNNKKLQKAAGGFHPIPVEPKLWHQVGMDLMGPMPETPRGNRYIITLTDYFSKWAEACCPS